MIHSGTVDIVFALLAVVVGACSTPGSRTEFALRVFVLVCTIVAWVVHQVGTPLPPVVVIGLVVEVMREHRHDAMRAIIVVLGAAATGRSIGLHYMVPGETMFRSVLLGMMGLAWMAHVRPMTLTTFDALACVLVGWPGESTSLGVITSWNTSELHCMQVVALVALVLVGPRRRRGPMHIHECAYIMGPWPGSICNAAVIAVAAECMRWNDGAVVFDDEETQTLRV